MSEKTAENRDLVKVATDQIESLAIDLKMELRRERDDALEVLREWLPELEYRVENFPPCEVYDGGTDCSCGTEAALLLKRDRIRALLDKVKEGEG